MQLIIVKYFEENRYKNHSLSCLQLAGPRYSVKQFKSVKRSEATVALPGVIAH
jgi:hypothetical protein